MSASQSPSVPTIEYAEFDAMKEVASTLKAAYFRQSLAATSEVEIAFWSDLEDVIAQTVRRVNPEDLDDIQSAAQLFARLLVQLESTAEAA